MRPASVIALMGAIVLCGCADPQPPGDGGAASSTGSPGPGSERVLVYEALIRHLVDPEGTQPIYILADLCFQLMDEEPRCPDHLDVAEQRDLGARLGDLGEIVSVRTMTRLRRPTSCSRRSCSARSSNGQTAFASRAARSAVACAGTARSTSCSKARTATRSRARTTR